MVDVQRAVEFVRKECDVILQGRLESILEKRKPDRTVLDTIESMRKSDGGFAFWDQDISCITSTLNVVGWLDDLSLSEEAVVSKTFDFLLRHQQKDGGWDEIEKVSIFNPPPFMVPGEMNTRIWLTACCAHWFIRFDRAKSLGAKTHPTEFLTQHLSPSGLIKGYLYASWDSLVMFHYNPGPESDAFTSLLRATRENFDSERHDGADLAWLLRCLRDVGLGTKDELVVRVLNALEKNQDENGSWISADGAEFSGMTTVDAIRVLNDFGRIK
ncbi:MAG: terpene cyclase/mutase family protein [Candidatus Thorarchaeota archaeon]|nr:MAG: terpene cyclase/mutase family protein [Candidatus Thorarchaeota archaeon]